MKFEKELIARSNGVCELSGNSKNLTSYLVEPKTGNYVDDFVYIESELAEQLVGNKTINPNSWHCLNESIWSEVDAVKVVSYRILQALQTELWAVELLDQMYLEDDVLSWAKATLEDEDSIQHIDSNGVVLNQGDSVVLIKDLDVKGSSLVAKRGTAVRNIRLVHNDPDLIEGKVNGQTIYIRTEFVKK